MFTIASLIAVFVRAVTRPFRNAREALKPNSNWRYRNDPVAQEMAALWATTYRTQGGIAAYQTLVKVGALRYAGWGVPEIEYVIALAPAMSHAQRLAGLRSSWTVDSCAHSLVNLVVDRFHPAGADYDEAIAWMLAYATPADEAAFRDFWDRWHDRADVLRLTATNGALNTEPPILPGMLAAYSCAAGLTTDEAANRYADGTLTLDSLRVLVGMRGFPVP